MPTLGAAAQNVYGMGYNVGNQQGDFVSIMGHNAAVALVAALEASNGALGGDLRTSLSLLQNVTQTRSGVEIIQGTQPISVNADGVHTASVETLFAWNGQTMVPVASGQVQ